MGRPPWRQLLYDIYYPRQHYYPTQQHSNVSPPPPVHLLVPPSINSSPHDGSVTGTMPKPNSHSPLLLIPSTHTRSGHLSFTSSMSSTGGTSSSPQTWTQTIRPPCKICSATSRAQLSTIACSSSNPLARTPGCRITLSNPSSTPSTNLPLTGRISFTPQGYTISTRAGATSTYPGRLCYASPA